MRKVQKYEIITAQAAALFLIFIGPSSFTVASSCAGSLFFL